MRPDRFGAMIICIGLVVVVLVLYLPQYLPERELWIVTGGIISGVGVIVAALKYIHSAYLLFHSKLAWSLHKSNKSWLDAKLELISQIIGVGLALLGIAILTFYALQ